ncbi:hypothetical protein DFH07DRAFT_877270 [Mycena maculata]|uniref:DUF5648 domain-containing protein n=1 Tax=Mycena maculata TaxID=230809 RepID=A0AAD7NTY5_9AGAR|nr:hypothetical protein DFH07DRAFT_877270 [Mycena maculata]
MNTLAYLLATCLSIGAKAMVRADSCAGPSQAAPLYRDWNPSISDHFYTPDLAEYNTANENGYIAEGIRLSIFSTQVAGSVQFIRLWNALIGDHFYTTNATEAQVATGGGYIIETQAEKMYIYPTQLCGSVPLYRAYSAGGTDHFYTINATEMNGAEDSGWAYEWIAGYVFPPPADASSGTAATPTTATSTKIATTTTTAAGPPQSTLPATTPTSTLTSTLASSSTSISADGVAAPSDAEIQTGPVIPASTTILGGSSAADSQPSSTATGTSGAIRSHLEHGIPFIILAITVGFWV